MDNSGGIEICHRCPYPECVFGSNLRKSQFSVHKLDLDPVLLESEKRDRYCLAYVPMEEQYYRSHRSFNADINYL